MSALMERIRQENLSIFESVNKFIDCTKTARLAQAKAQAAELSEFQQNLQQSTEQFLTTTAQERLAQAKAQATQLRQFRKDLFMSVIGESGL